MVHKAWKKNCTTQRFEKFCKLIFHKFCQVWLTTRSILAPLWVSHSVTQVNKKTPQPIQIFAAKKTYEYLINLKPAAKELDGSKFSKWVKQLPNVIDGKKIKQTDVDLIFAKSKPASERKLSLENFVNNAIAKVAEIRYPWLESTGEGLESPCAREFMKKHVFLWNECAELVWMVSILC